MTEEMKNIVAKWRNKGVNISDEEAENLLWQCKRKIKISKILNPEGYLPLLYDDEVRNYLHRQSVNATTILRKMKEDGVCAVSV